MSISITSKLKYPENLISNNEKKIEVTKDNLTFLKQMQNMKINTYAKFLKETKKKSSIVSLSSRRVTKNRQDKLSPDTEVESQKLRSQINQLEEEDEDLTLVDQSSLPFQGGGNKNLNFESEDAEIKNIHSSTSHDFEKNNPFAKNLEIIIEQETQRTETLSNENKKSSPNYSTSKEAFILNLTNISNSSLDDNPQFSKDYLIDIYINLLEEEKQLKPLFGYMKNQTDMNEKMRAILIDWIVDVHFKFKLVPETLFLSINLIDRYLSLKVVKRDQLQLIGVVALLIACKYEEIFSPELRDFEYITNKAYKKEEMTRLELEILKLFSFDITFPSSLRFFEIIAATLKLNHQDLSLGRYLLEIFLLDYRCTKFTGSEIASSVAFLVFNLKSNRTDSTTKECKKLTRIFDINKSHLSHRFKFEDLNQLNNFWYEKIKECSKDICFILENIDNTGLLTIKKKFMTPEFDQIARYTSQVVN
jgi:hypothetical protein